MKPKVFLDIIPGKKSGLRNLEIEKERKTREFNALTGDN